MDNEQLKANVTSGKQWVRLLYMVLYAVALYFASILMWIVVVLQFLFALITGKDNAQLRSFGYSLSTYLYEVYKFLTYSSDEKPFPFADWPDTPDEIKAKVQEFKSPEQEKAASDATSTNESPASSSSAAATVVAADVVASEVDEPKADTETAGDTDGGSVNSSNPVASESVIHLSSEDASNNSTDTDNSKNDTKNS